MVNKDVLPVVSEGVKYSIEGELADNPKMLVGVAERIYKTQPELAHVLFGWVQLAGRDADERANMLNTGAFVYRLLEAQAEADLMNDSFSDSKPDDYLE